VRNDRGFTLIEVLAAILIVSLVFGLLLEAVTRNLADLSRARAEGRAAQLAENRLRDLRADLEVGTKLQDGIQEVAPQKIKLPPDYPGELPPSPLFEVANERARPVTPGEEAPLRMIAVRVYAADVDPETVDPFVVLVTAPTDPAKLQQLQQQQLQQQNGVQNNGGGRPTLTNPPPGGMGTR